VQRVPVYLVMPFRPDLSDTTVKSHRVLRWFSSIEVLGGVQANWQLCSRRRHLSVRYGTRPENILLKLYTVSYTVLTLCSVCLARRRGV